MKKLMTIIVQVVMININLLIAQETCITNAWSAYNSEKYLQAIESADNCIEEFGKEALLIQNKLDSLKIIPEEGRVNDVQKNRIFNNGLLNDVSTACYIKGRSAEHLYKADTIKNLKYKQVAIEAYTLAEEFNKGRCWDTRGWFWSPSKKSLQRLPIN